MNKKLSILLCISLVLMTVLGGCGSANKNIRMGAGDIGGIYYSFSGAFAGIFNKDNTASKIELKNTAGSAANIRLLSGRYIDLGIAQMDIADSAYNGNGPSDEKKYQGYKAIATLYTEACQIVVKEDSDIASADDLEGKLIGVQQGTTGHLYCADDFGEDNVIPYANGATAVQALLQGKVDCVVIDQEPAKAFVEANEGLKILETAYTTEDYAAAVSKDNPALTAALNSALQELKDDGTIQGILDKYIKAE